MENEIVEVHNKSTRRKISIQRVIGKIKGNSPGPTVVFLGGIHGNEQASIIALDEIFQLLNKKTESLKGNIYAIAGNLSALKEGIRYITQDLNRLWTEENIKKIIQGTTHQSANSEDVKEQLEIYAVIDNILKTNPPPFYFIDLHTVSSNSIPFIAINDRLVNRKLAQKFPVPVVLGIEEYVEGAFLDYINNLGHTAIAFEAGQHEAEESITRISSFIWLTLYYSGNLFANYSFEFDLHYNQLSEASKRDKNIFEIRHRYSIKKSENFEMKPGYLNFQKIKKSEPLAKNINGKINASEGGRIFMPHYQKLGDDGFFIIRHIPKFLLALSSLLRRINFESVLVSLPGINWKNGKKGNLLVNADIARFLATEFFHLLGYRRIHKVDNFIEFTRREYDAKPRENINQL